MKITEGEHMKQTTEDKIKNSILIDTVYAAIYFCNFT